MRKQLTKIAGILLLTAPFAASAATISLSGTVRDFSVTHADFQRAIDGHVTGMVESVLGADGKPVYTGKCTSSVESCGANFGDWFNTTAGVNLALSHAITLDNAITPDPNVYTYDSSSFFPIDGLGWGNESYGHNFHFTYELATTFTYQGGEEFAFRGDDDVWVFVDDQLVVDLGGVHGPVSGSVALDSLGLIAGNDYGFNLFFAERHCCGSNFRIDTSMALKENVEPPAVPEVEGYAMLVAGLGLIGWVARRRMK